MFAAETDLCPTFLSVSTDATHFDLVHAQFRVVGLPDAPVFAPERPTLNPRSIWSAYDGNMPAVDWMFFDLLHRFLKAGPRLSQPEQVDRHITVQRLEINVLSPADRSLLPEPTKGVQRFWNLARHPNIRRRLSRTDAEMENLRRTQMRPEWLCDWIAENIRRLTEMDYKTMDYGGIFYERIGEIVVLLDGEEKAAFKLGKMLSELPREADPWGFTIRETRKVRFGKWKERTIKERLEAGLPVVDSSA
ncbi:hypothetical protein C8R45DRAFT_954685 [Mycena sanguinolenta]|nr:hypothetical protein C8R45DRAFT_954685 [Mycena sanguinolenta]